MALDVPPWHLYNHIEDVLMIYGAYPFTGQPPRSHQTTQRSPLTLQRSSKLVSDIDSHSMIVGAPTQTDYVRSHPTHIRAGGHLEPALEHYNRAKKFGIDRAELHIRNVGTSRLSYRPRERTVFNPMGHNAFTRSPNFFPG
jgi:hypothetical protein